MKNLLRFTTLKSSSVSIGKQSTSIFPKRLLCVQQNSKVTQL